MILIVIFKKGKRNVFDRRPRSRRLVAPGSGSGKRLVPQYTQLSFAITAFEVALMGRRMPGHGARGTAVRYAARAPSRSENIS
jgi:hypothetical protein